MKRFLSVAALVAALCVSSVVGAKPVQYGKNGTANRGSSTGSPATLSGAYPQSWEAAILAAFQKVNGQIGAQSFPTFDFTEGSLAASRLVFTATGTASATQTQSYMGGAIVIQIGAGAGNELLNPLNTSSINGVSQGAPFAIASRVMVISQTISTSTLYLPAMFLDTTKAFYAAVGVSPASATVSGSSFTTLGSTTNFLIQVGGSAGTFNAITSFVIPPLNTWYDIGLLWDGSRWIAFYGQALQGTFVPDLVNTCNTMIPGKLTIPSMMPVVDVIDAATTAVVLDKYTSWTGVNY